MAITSGRRRTTSYAEYNNSYYYVCKQIRSFGHPQERAPKKIIWNFKNWRPMKDRANDRPVNMMKMEKVRETGVHEI